MFAPGVKNADISIRIGEEVIGKCFEGTPSRIGGVGFEEIAKETHMRHAEGFGDDKLLPSGGIYQWRRDGEFHMWNPESISAIHCTCPIAKCKD